MAQPDIIITTCAADFVDELVNIQRVVYEGSKTEDSVDALHAEHFLSMIAAFPDGQFMAVDAATGRVVGHTASMRIGFDPTQPFVEPWVVTTGYGHLTTHVPDGDWMYGVESAVLPEFQRQGVGSRLYAARFALAQRLNLRGIVAGSTIMGYHEHAATLSPDDYVSAVVAGLLYDNNLSKQLRKGFRVLNVIPDYVTDALSCGYGAAIVWDNPTCDPSQPSLNSSAV